mgnify:CR=1 FL=1
MFKDFAKKLLEYIFEHFYSKKKNKIDLDKAEYEKYLKKILCNFINEFCYYAPADRVFVSYLHELDEYLKNPELKFLNQKVVEALKDYRGCVVSFVSFINYNASPDGLYGRNTKLYEKNLKIYQKKLKKFITESKKLIEKLNNIFY